MVAVGSAVTHFDAKATEIKTVMLLLQNCCLVVVPDVWFFF